MEVVVKGKLLDVLEKEYEFEGKQGISCRAVIYDNGKLEQIKVPRETVKHYRNMIGQDVDLKCSLFINGKYSLTLGK